MRYVHTPVPQERADDLKLCAWSSAANIFRQQTSMPDGSWDLVSFRQTGEER